MYCLTVLEIVTLGLLASMYARRTVTAAMFTAGFLLVFNYGALVLTLMFHDSLTFFGNISFSRDNYWFVMWAKGLFIPLLVVIDYFYVYKWFGWNRTRGTRSLKSAAPWLSLPIFRTRRRLWWQQLRQSKVRVVGLILACLFSLLLGGAALNLVKWTPCAGPRKGSFKVEHMFVT